MAITNHRPASTNNTSPFLKKRPHRLGSRPLPPEVVAKLATPPLSFDRTAAVNLHLVLPQAFIAANTNPDISGWCWPSARAFLGALQEAIWNHSNPKGRPMGAVLHRKGFRLVIGFVDDVDEGSLTAVCSGDLAARSVFGNWRGPGYSLNFLASADEMPSAVIVPDFRLGQARSKISVPNRRWVHGPYLLVASVEESTGLVVRIRLWPAWVDLALDRFALIRSMPERVFVSAVNDAGGVVFCASHEGQLATLQNRYHRVWAGDISKYPFLPDGVILPVLGRMPTIAELFGLARFKHYALGMETKLPKALGGEARELYEFEAFMGLTGTAKAVEMKIRDQVARLFAEPRSSLFAHMPHAA
jgi:hypothetical protein